jgi:hypothetical protein
MSESPSLDVHKAKALELAVQAGGEPAKVVERAHAYHEFLNGKATGKPAGAAAAQTTTATPKPAAATTGKPAAAPKATPAPGTKPAAAAKPGAAAPKAAAAAAPGAAPKGDTKDPKGNNTYDDVTAALQKVMRSVPGDDKKHDAGRKLAYEILAAKGGGVKGVRDLKPALYDAVVAGCEAAIKPGAAVAPKAAAPKAATVVEDDLGQAVDTTGADAETAGADDPPEGGSGEGEDA